MNLEIQTVRRFYDGIAEERVSGYVRHSRQSLRAIGKSEGRSRKSYRLPFAKYSTKLPKKRDGNVHEITYHFVQLTPFTPQSIFFWIGYWIWRSRCRCLYGVEHDSYTSIIVARAEAAVLQCRKWRADAFYWIHLIIRSTNLRNGEYGLKNGGRSRNSNISVIYKS